MNCPEIAISQVFVLQRQGLCYPPSKKKKTVIQSSGAGLQERETWGLWLLDAHISLTHPGLGLGSYPAALKVLEPGQMHRAIASIA